MTHAPQPPQPPRRRVLSRAARTAVLLVPLLAVTALAGCGSTAGTSPSPVVTTRRASATAPSTPPATTTAGLPTTASPTPQTTESNPPGDIPDNQAFVPYAPPGARFSVKVPEGWARTTVPGGTTFTDKLNQIQITTVAASSAPSPASVRGADLPRLRASVPRFASGQVTAVTRAGVPTVLITYEGDSAPNPVTGKVVRDAFERYIYFRAGTRVDLTLIGPTNADNVDPWRIVSDSITWS